MLTLYNLALSGNCHKVRLMLGLLKLPYTTNALNMSAGEHRSPEYLAMNPFAQAPVLDDDGFALRDSQAILVYLAKRYGGAAWWPEDAGQLGEIMAWLSTAANEIAHGPNLLRLNRKFGRVIDVDRASLLTANTLKVIDAHLENRQWMVGRSVSIADLALYPYIALSPEGGVDLATFPNILRWIGAIRDLPGYVDMPGMIAPTP